MQAQELDIEGKKSEAERKASLAKKLNIASFITSLMYCIVMSVLIPVIAYYVVIDMFRVEDWDQAHAADLVLLK